MLDRMRSDGEAEMAGGVPPRRNLFAQVVDELGRRVVRGDFARRGVLPIEPQLAAELGVSRNLLREAVKVLAGKGLLEVRPRSGTRPRAQLDWHLLDPDVLAWLDTSGHRLEHSFDLVEFRLIIEPKASYLAAVRAILEEKRAIAAACAALEACVGRPELVPDRDGAFHRSIHAASGNAILNYLGSLIASLMQVQVLMTTDLPGSFERGLPLHRELTEAILRGDGPAAEDTSSRLIQMPYNDLAGRRRLATTEHLSAAGPARAGRGRSRTIASGFGP
jgi:GntR family transcriptional regulator, galactonate operon transcriptional repressor